MITLTREEAQNVLNLLILWLDEQEEPDTETAIETLRAKLSEPTIDGWPLYSGLPQPEPEPMAYMDGKGHLYNSTTHPENYTPLYTAPPQREWVGLTDDERIQVLHSGNKEGYLEYAKGIEAKLKEKNG